MSTTDERTGYFILIDPECCCCTCRGWMTEFGADHLPIIDPRAILMTDLTGVKTRNVYADLSRMSDFQIERYIRLYSQRTEYSPERIRNELAEFGMPIKTEKRVISNDLEEGRRIIRFRRSALESMTGRRA